MRRMHDDWIQLQPGLVCSQLADGRMQVVASGGKTYYLGAHHSALLIVLHGGASLRQFEAEKAHRREWNGTMLMLEELHLLVYSRKGDGSAAQATICALVGVDMPDKGIAASISAASAVLILLCIWQISVLGWFYGSANIMQLPRIALGEILQSPLTGTVALGLLLWVAFHELAHAAAARCCGVRDGTIRWHARGLLKPTFYAPPQALLKRSDVRFIIFSAGPLIDLLCALGLALAWQLAAPAQAAALKALFIISMLIGLPNCCMSTHTDMGQAMRAFTVWSRSRIPSAIYGAVSSMYAAVVLLMAVKMALLSRPGLV